MSSLQQDESLASLLAQVRDGDEAALTQVLEKYEPRLRTAAHVLLGPLLRPQMDSVDLVQSVHRVLLPVLREGKYDFSSSEELVALALTVVRRKIARNWRRLRLEQKHAPKGKENFAPAEDHPVENALAKDALEYLFAQLTEEERRLVKLRLEGYSTVEIARTLNYEAPALRARLSRLRQRLRSNGCTKWI